VLLRSLGRGREQRPIGSYAHFSRRARALLDKCRFGRDVLPALFVRYRLMPRRGPSAAGPFPGVRCGPCRPVVFCLAARFRSTRRTSSSTAPACRASSAHWAGPARSLLDSSRRSATAIWRRTQSFCGLHPIQAGMRPPLRSIVASMSRAWWHHTALPAGVSGAAPIRWTKWSGGRRRARPPGRRSTHPPPSRPAPHLSRHPNDHPRQPPTASPRPSYASAPDAPSASPKKHSGASSQPRKPGAHLDAQPGRRRQPRPATPAPRAHPG
jgi:hypothetical protein